MRRLSANYLREKEMRYSTTLIKNIEVRQDLSSQFKQFKVHCSYANANRTESKFYYDRPRQKSHGKDSGQKACNATRSQNILKYNKRCVKLILIYITQSCSLFIYFFILLIFFLLRKLCN